jgi:hypothetical protein
MTDLWYQVIGDIDMTQTFVAVDHQHRRDELKDDPSNPGFRTSRSSRCWRVRQSRLGVHVVNHLEESLDGEVVNSGRDTRWGVFMS